MPSSPQPQNSHQATFQTVRDCLLKTNKLGKEEFTNELKQHKGILAQFQLWLFLHPLSIHLIPIAFFLVSLGPAFIIRKLVNSITLRLIILLIWLLLYLMIPLFLVKLTPRFEMEWGSKWSSVFNYYCDYSYKGKIVDKSEAKRKIKRAIFYYRQEGEPFKFLVNIMWGGIFIGCLPDSNFQKALIAMSPSEIYHANLFGSVCLFFLPFLYTYYFFHYEIPIARMENVITQVELEE